MDNTNIEIELNNQIENNNNNYIYIKINIDTDVDTDADIISIESITEYNNEIGTYLRLDKQELMISFLRIIQIDQDGQMINIEKISKNINIYVPNLDNVIQVPMLIEQILKLSTNINISKLLDDLVE